MPWKPIVGVVAIIIPAFWLTMPPERLIVDRNCQIHGPSVISEKIYAEHFWRPQLQALEDERRKLVLQPEREAKLDAAVEQMQATARARMQAIYSKHPELAPSPAEERAAQLRELADEIEQADTMARLDNIRLARIVGIDSCELEIQQRERLADSISEALAVGYSRDEIKSYLSPKIVAARNAGRSEAQIKDQFRIAPWRRADDFLSP